MWIRTNDVICKANDFLRIYMEDMSYGRYGVFGKAYDSTAIALGMYKDAIKAREALNDLYAALERGDNAFVMPKSDAWY